MSSCLHLLKEVKTVQYIPRRGLYLMEVVSYTGFRHHRLIVHSSVFIFSVVSWTYKVCMFYLDLINADISLLLRPLYSRNFIKTGHTVPLKYKYVRYLYSFLTLFVLCWVKLNDKYILLDGLVCGIVGYFNKSRRILASPSGEWKYKRRVNIPWYYILSRPIIDLLFNSRCFKIELSKYEKREYVID